MNNIPSNITRPQPNLIKINWNDGFESIITIENLRKSCPCAYCLEKAKNQLSANKFVMPTIRRGQYEIKKIEPVGNYALMIVWGDGHNAGIWTWDFLREVFERYKMNSEEIKKATIAFHENNKEAKI